MTATIRFCQNNLASADAATLTAASALSGFPIANAVSIPRTQRYTTAGAFRVTSTNKNIYINDGSDKTISLTEAVYATASALCSHIQTKLNASSSSWTCAYSSTTHKFTIGRSAGTAILRFTQTTDAAWSMLGYAGLIDTSAGTGLAADAIRLHTSERISFDLGSAVEVLAFFAIGAIDQDFGIADTATCMLKANSIDDYDTAALTVSLPAADIYGIHKFLDDLGVSTIYRYWWFDFEDKTNPNGPNFEMKIYLGDYVTLENRNLSTGFESEMVDPSTIRESDAGSPFFLLKPKYWQFSGLSEEWLADDDRTEMVRMYRELGNTTPFYVSLDPSEAISASVSEFTKYVTFTDFKMSHMRWKYYAIKMGLREVVG